MKLEVDLTIANPITSDNDFKSLIDLSVGSYSQGSTIYAFPIITSIIQYSQTCRLFPVFLFIYQLAFYSYLCNFTQIYFGFLKKNLRVFLMVFDGKPTPIFEPTLVQRLLYIITNDPKIDVGLQL